jgi:S1-C subfamily serine protease
MPSKKKKIEIKEQRQSEEGAQSVPVEIAADSPLQAEPLLTADLRSAQSAPSAKFVATVVLLSLLAGGIGGAGGVFLLSGHWPLDFSAFSGKGSIGEEDSANIGPTVQGDIDAQVVAVVKKVSPAVFSIVGTKDLPKVDEFFFSPFGDGDDFFSSPFRFRVPSAGETERQEVSAGTGFFISEEGLALSNKHVVGDESAEYTAVLNDGRRLKVTVLARDPFNDVAVLKVEGGQDFPFVTLGDSETVEIGSSVIAIGNTLGQFRNTVTTGVVSGIGRTITAGGGLIRAETLKNVIQTDAAINPGNSGGPLLNLAGAAIGMNTAISSSGQLVGFSIPINDVKEVVSDVQKFGKILRPFLGIRYTIINGRFAEANDLSVDYGALLVRGSGTGEVAVVPGSPAAEAGLKEGDIVLEINGEKVTEDNAVVDILRKKKPGDIVTLKVLSNARTRDIRVTLGEAK